MKIQEEKKCIDLLLSTTKGQVRGLIYTASKNQVLALSELALNVLKGKLIKLTHRRRTFLEVLANQRKSDRIKYTLLKKHWMWIWQILKSVEDDLKQAMI